MAKSKTKGPAGLLSESAKLAGRGIAGVAKKAVGKPTRSRKSPTGTLAEAAKKAGRAVGRAAKVAVGKKPRSVKSGSQ
jgi:hypothetical protein